MAYYRAGRTREALVLLEKAAALDPLDAETYNNLAIVNEDLDRLPRAIDLYKKAIQANPAHSKAYNNLAYLYLQSGDTLLNIQREFAQQLVARFEEMGDVVYPGVCVDRAQVDRAAR